MKVMISLAVAAGIAASAWMVPAQAYSGLDAEPVYAQVALLDTGTLPATEARAAAVDPGGGFFALRPYRTMYAVITENDRWPGSMGGDSPVLALDLMPPAVPQKVPIR